MVPLLFNNRLNKATYNEFKKNGEHFISSTVHYPRVMFTYSPIQEETLFMIITVITMKNSSIVTVLNENELTSSERKYKILKPLIPDECTTLAQNTLVV